MRPHVKLLALAGFFEAFAQLPLAHAEEAPQLLTFGTGIASLAGASWLDAPAPERFTLPASGERVRYPTFWGATFGGGLYLEGRLYGIVGLEVDVFYSRESLSGDARRAGEVAEVTFRQSAFRIPILLKGILPLGAWSPFVVVGPEVAVYGLSDAESAPQGRLRSVASANPATWIVLGAGAEYRLPIPSLDLRMPLALRASMNPSVNDELDERVTALPSDAVVFESAPRYQVTLTAAVGIYF